MDRSFCKRSTTGLMALSATALGLGLAASSALAQGTVCPPNCAAVGGEQKQMVRKAHMALQGREAYQPNVIQHPNGKYLLFVGTHSGTHANPLPPANGASQPNGTLIVDVTNVNAPIELYHIPGTRHGVFPGGVGSGQSQMVRMCKGRDLPPIAGLNAATQNQKLYMMRNVGDAYETYDVTNPSAPVWLADTLNMGGAGVGTLAVTHKMWWECSSGLVYAPGSRTADGFRQDQSMLVMDWKNPRMTPNLIRTWTLPGGQKDATGPIPTSLHGPISSFEHPDRFNPLSRPFGPNDVVGNRIYGAWGVGDDGVLVIHDRNKLLPANSTGGTQAPVIAYGGTWDGSGSGKIPELGAASIPTNAQLLLSQQGVLDMSPDQGGHTSFPIFGIEPPSYQSYTQFGKRDMVILASEATSNLCAEPPHWSFMVDVTVENTKTDNANFPPLRALPDPWQGPMVLSTLATDPRDGQAYSRGNYCTRGSRFGTHSSEENFENPYYPRCTFVALFTGGVRTWDIREPQTPKEIAFFVPGDAQYPNYMTNNLEVDNRGNIYPVDRVGAGGEILQLTGASKNACLGM